MNVLSLFDGMSCGQIALERAGIEVDNYYASEIDKYAIKITQKNYPNTIQLGDINNWRGWVLPPIDLIIGGSPCQGFSYAGKQLNFEDPRSRLFFTFVDILNHINPKYFLLENVRMKQEYQDIITGFLGGVRPIEIDSALVSAQTRKRLYWTNLPKFDLPEDKGILLKDIIEEGEVDREKSYCIDANYYKGGNYSNYRLYTEKARRQIVYLPNHQSNRRLVVKVANVYPSGGQNGNVYSVDGKSPTLSAGVGVVGRGIGSSNSPKITDDGIVWRKLTVTECERLQTVSDGYTEGVSDTQRYKMLGNGWTVDVIAHIFKGLNKDEVLRI